MKPLEADGAMTGLSDRSKFELADQWATHVLMLGAPNGPGAVARFSAELGRCCGKTHAMIMALPADGNAVVVVLKLPNWFDWMRRRILDQRPDYPVNRLVVLTKEQVERPDGEAFLASNGLPVFVDNAVTDELAIDYVQGLQP